MKGGKQGIVMFFSKDSEGVFPAACKTKTLHDSPYYIWDRISEHNQDSDLPALDPVKL